MNLVSKLVGWLGLGAAIGCGSGEAVRPKDPTAADVTAAQTGAAESPICRDPHAEGTPLVVDWKAEQRADLEIAMKQGVVVAHYDCQSIRLLADCRAGGGYAFAGEAPSEKVLALNSASEVRATLPLNGGSLGASLGRNASIDIAFVTVGKRTTTSPTVPRSDLKGSCEGATHFVRAADVGAFAMRTGTVGAVRSAAELFGAGVKASSTSSRTVTSNDGEYSACAQATAGASKPPAQCGAPVRIQLVSVADAR